MDELDLNFTIFVTPTLISEIIANLRHPAPRDGKLPEEIVMALARKMAGGRAVQQMHFRPLGIANLNQHDVPMFGQVIVDSSAPNVLTTADKKGLVYDSLHDVEMWERWAHGDFSEPEKLGLEMALWDQIDRTRNFIALGRLLYQISFMCEIGRRCHRHSGDGNCQ